MYLLLENDGAPNAENEAVSVDDAEVSPKAGNSPNINCIGADAWLPLWVLDLAKGLLKLSNEPEKLKEGVKFKY